MSQIIYKKLKVYVVLNYGGPDPGFGVCSEDVRILGIYTERLTALEHANGLMEKYPGIDISITKHSVKDFRCMHINNKALA